MVYLFYTISVFFDPRDLPDRELSGLFSARRRILFSQQPSMSTSHGTVPTYMYAMAPDSCIPEVGLYHHEEELVV